MTDTIESPEQELMRLRAENEALKTAKPPKGLSFRVSQKGAVSIYGLGRFPVTLYASQWERLIDVSGQLSEFIKAHQVELATKG